MYPHFTIVIPTRNRLDTLKWTLQTCLAQNYDRMSIIVGDNCCEDGTAEYIDQINDTRIVRTRSESPLPMCENWNSSINLFINNDSYFFFLGDDDGLLPGAITFAAKLIAQLNTSVLSWRKIDYCWPTVIVPEYRNYIRISLRSTIRQVSSSDFLNKSHRFETNYTEGPNIYSSFVHGSVLKKLKEIDGKKIFRSFSPDLYSGYAIAALTDTFFKCDFALSISGGSHHSNGISWIFQPSSIMSEKHREENVIHSSLAHAPSIATAEADSLLSARDALPSLFKNYHFDWMSYLNKLKNEAVAAQSLEAREMILQAIKHSTKTQGIDFNFELSLEDDYEKKFLKQTYGFNTNSIALSSDLSSIDIKDVFHASKFVDAVFSLKHLECEISVLEEGHPLKMSRIAFMHVPKSSGTSLSKSLVDSICPKNVVFGVDRHLYGEFNDFNSMSEQMRSNIYLHPHDLPENADYISGHFFLSTLTERYKDLKIITVMREPMSRILSSWAFDRVPHILRSFRSDQGSYGELMMKISHKSFFEYLSNPEASIQNDNLFLRMLLHPHPLIPVSNFISKDFDEFLIAEGLRRIEQISHVNIYENPSLDADISKWLGIPVSRSIMNENTYVDQSLVTQLENELTPETCSAWRDRSRLDRALWLSVAGKVIPDVNLSKLEEDTLLKNSARYSRILLGEPISLTQREPYRDSFRDRDIPLPQSISVLQTSRSWRLIVGLRKIALRYPWLSKKVWQLMLFTYWIFSFKLYHQIENRWRKRMIQKKSKL